MNSVSLAMVGAALSSCGLCSDPAFFAVITSRSFGRLLSSIARARKQRAMVRSARLFKGTRPRAIA